MAARTRERLARASGHHRDLIRRIVSGRQVRLQEGADTAARPALAARRYVIVMPDADMDRAVANISESLFGCAGPRCLRGSVVVRGRVRAVRDKLLDARRIWAWYGLDPGITMGPSSRRHRRRCSPTSRPGARKARRLLLDGREQVDKHPPATLSAHRLRWRPTGYDNWKRRDLRPVASGPT